MAESFQGDPRIEHYRTELISYIRGLQPLMAELPPDYQIDLEQLESKIQFGKAPVPSEQLHPLLAADPEIYAQYNAYLQAETDALIEIGADAQLYLNKRSTVYRPSYTANHVISAAYQSALSEKEDVTEVETPFNSIVFSALKEYPSVKPILDSSPNARIQLRQRGFNRDLLVDGYYCLTLAHGGFSLPGVTREFTGDDMNICYGSIMATVFDLAKEAGSFAALNDQFLRGIVTTKGIADHPNLAIGVAKVGNLLAQRTGWGTGWLYLASAFQYRDTVAFTGYLDWVGKEQLQLDKKASEALTNEIVRLTVRNYLEDQYNPKPSELLRPDREHYDGSLN